MSRVTDIRKLRPWYFVAAMGVMWVMGVFGAMSGCSEVGYLRGSHEMTDELRREIDETDNPLWRMELVRQQARLEALAEHHDRAFPLSVARMILCSLLVVASGSALAGRKGARGLALQAILANASLALLTFALLTPVRRASADAVARDAAVHQPLPLPDLGEAEAIDFYRNQQLDAERLRAGLEAFVFGLAALALTRRRTRAYFEAAEQALADAGGAEP
ncbi:MAG: hypothetical protein R3B72_26165 [Polyangiaceae bacterium]